jgi:aspartyl-tRNA(Asn)/glutamyl-tRNA(Gln) amidotransferase subunit B
MGYPGVLPALNEEAIKKAYLVAQALHCTLSPATSFARKNYFYPDLPKNYQISQFASPVGRNGYIDLEFHRKKKRIGIHEVHLEEDAGKMIHAGDMSLLDYNRAGTPLLEIVTEPELEIGEEAELFLQNLRRMVRYLGVCDGNMEQGSMRCDANVSVNLRGKGLGNKVEIKNMNSSRFVRKALTFEIERHQEILDRGGTILLETRLWNENRDLTETMRKKEEANDYRYFPEPDLPPFKPTPEFLAAVQSNLVELPEERKLRLIESFSLNESQVEFLIEEKARADFFEETVALGVDPTQVAVWLGGDVKKMLNRRGIELEESPLTPNRLAALLKLLDSGRIHGKIAKQVLEAVFDTEHDPEAIIKERGWEQITDVADIERVLDEVIRKHPQVVEVIEGGDTKPMGFLVGQVMQATSGRAEPRLVQAALKRRFPGGSVTLLEMGGAITGKVENGKVVSAEPGTSREILARLIQNSNEEDRAKFAGASVEILTTDRPFSEEVDPEDWATLLSTVERLTSDGNASGVVITHGTDTLPYTAPLLYWFFADTKIPIVLTASTQPGAEAQENIRQAILKASSAERGIYVVIHGETHSAINLKFERVAPDGFGNWNLEKPAFSGKPISSPHQGLPERTVLKERLEAALRTVYVARVFPGMRADSLIDVMESGVHFLILELYDTGTANVRPTQFSIRKALLAARDRDVRVYCTSQQEGIVDFSEYPAAHELWKEGAVPMGRLTTETVYARLLAALVLADNDDEAQKLMEVADA